MLHRLRHSLTTVVKPVPPYSFELTVRKPNGWDAFTPFEVYEPGVLWSGVRVSGKPVGVKLTSLGTTDAPKVRVDLYGQKHGVLKALEEKLDFHTPLADFYTFAAKDSILSVATKDLTGMRGVEYDAVFSSVVLAICLQMATYKRGINMLESLINHFGDTLRFDGHTIKLYPTPERIASATTKQLNRQCNLGYRAERVRMAAKAIVKGFPDLRELLKMPPDEARAKLLTLPGIGDCSASIISPHGEFPLDAWSVTVFGQLFGMSSATDAANIHAVKLEAERRWGRKWLAFMYVVNDTKNLSAHFGLSLRER